MSKRQITIYIEDKIWKDTQKLARAFSAQEDQTIAASQLFAAAMQSVFEANQKRRDELLEMVRRMNEQHKESLNKLADAFNQQKLPSKEAIKKLSNILQPSDEVIEILKEGSKPRSNSRKGKRE